MSAMPVSDTLRQRPAGQSILTLLERHSLQDTFVAAEEVPALVRRLPDEAEGDGGSPSFTGGPYDPKSPAPPPLRAKFALPLGG